MLTRILPISLFGIFIFFSCIREKKPEMIDVKIIEYRVGYIDKLAGSIPTSILPEKMTLILHEHIALTNIEGFLGQFSLSYIADLQSRKVITMLKLFDKNYYYEGEKGELPVGFAPFENMLLEKTSDTARILGFSCKKYYFHSDEVNNIEIWSTNEIDVIGPNSTTQYKDIPGVLLQFYSQLSVLRMLLTSEKYQEKNISNDIMLVPENYQRISRSAMENTLVELFK